MTFAGGGDTQYKVEVAVNSESDIIYSGWLSLSDLGQTFQPDPNVLTLIATDGIAFLQSVPLSDDDDRYLQGPHPLIKYIAWCLQKTGLNLDIWVQIDPRAWDNSMDVSINIGLGQGDVNERLQGLMMILQKQEQALSTMGADNPFVTMKL